VTKDHKLLGELGGGNPFAKIANVFYRFNRRLTMDDRRLIGNLGKNAPSPPSPPPFF